MREKVFTIVSSVVCVPKETITEASSSDNVEAWDSLKHINLILALEEAFGVQFDDEIIPELNSVDKILVALQIHKGERP